MQTPAEQGDCSGLTCSVTTGDDPDFTRTNTPAQAYSSADSCAGNCVDPTTSCDDVNNTCARTFTCNASATCNACQDLNLPTVYRGVQINAGYAAGIWSFFVDTTYTTITWSAPDGTETSAEIT